MQWKMQFGTENDAFTASPSAEIARILREAADKVEALQDTGVTEGPQPVYDVNGNLVGTFDFVRRIAPDRHPAAIMAEHEAAMAARVPA
jgi:hypothetical protein